MIYKNNNFMLDEDDCRSVDERFELIFEHKEFFKELFDRDILSFKDYMLGYSTVMCNLLFHHEDETKRILLSRKATVQELSELCESDLSKFNDTIVIIDSELTLFVDSMLFNIDNDLISIDEALLLKEDCMLSY